MVIQTPFCTATAQWLNTTTTKGHIVIAVVVVADDVADVVVVHVAGPVGNCSICNKNLSQSPLEL